MRRWAPDSTAVGKPAPVPLMLVHGFMGSGEVWGNLPQALLPGFDVAAVDLPGHGDSDSWSDPYEVPEVARFLGEVQEVVFGEPAWWLGYSMGGRIVMSAAVQGIPMRGALLESASPGLPTIDERAERSELDDARAEDILASGMAPFVDEWLRLPLFNGLRILPAEVQQASHRIRACQSETEMARWLKEGGTGRQPSYWESLKGLTLPLHALAGGEDRKFVDLGRRLCGQVYGATLSIAPGVGHTIHLEAPGAWLAWLRQSVDETEGRHHP